MYLFIDIIINSFATLRVKNLRLSVLVKYCEKWTGHQGDCDEVRKLCGSLLFLADRAAIQYDRLLAYHSVVRLSVCQ